MRPSRSRVSRRHLLALCSFLVPLFVLAWLGQSELQRQGSAARDALEREARTFLQSAAQAIEPQFERLPELVQRSAERLVREGALRTVLWLRETEGNQALLDIVLLDDSSALVWPEPPLLSLGLPFARDARPRGNETAITDAMQAADLLLTTGRIPQAIDVLEALVARFEEANPPNARTGRRDLDEPELAARFQLATAQRALGDLPAARAEFERVRAAGSTARRVTGGAYSEATTLALLAEAALAELGDSSDCVRLLRQIAESRREAADGLLSALALRLADRVLDADPLYGEAQQLLREERQRAQTRSFAGDYDSILKSELRRRVLRQRQGGSEAHGDLQIVSTLGRTTTMFWVRDASEQERARLRCARVGLHFDLGTLLAPALLQLASGSGTFVLSVADPSDTAMVPPPSEVPEDFIAPLTEVHGLSLRAWPANAERLIADAQAAQRNRMLLFLALFMTVLGGALWLWRSVSREAELAALKVDLVSRVSHELKTPLALIRMYGETLGLGRARDAAQAAHFGGIIARESERLTGLIQRILDFSQQQAGMLTYNREPVDLTALVRNVCEAYTPHLEARGAILIDSLQPEIQVLADPNATAGALVNLLENAAKYGIEGDDEHEIELDLRRDGDDALIEVRDRGRGVPNGEEERIFDGFYRASNAGEVRGAGLGLSLVRHFARAHGGDATAKARPGGGSVFAVRLPLTMNNPATSAANPAASPSRS